MIAEYQGITPEWIIHCFLCRPLAAARMDMAHVARDVFLRQISLEVAMDLGIFLLQRDHVFPCQYNLSTLVPGLIGLCHLMFFL